MPTPVLKYFGLILCLSIPLAVPGVAQRGLPAQQADRGTTEALAHRASERLQALQREADQLASDERTLLNELRALEIDRQITVEELRQATAAGDAVAAQLASTTDRINELERRDLAERPELRARLVEIYKLGRARYLRLLLSTPDMGQLGRTARLVASMAQLDRNRVAAHQRTLDSLTAARGELAARSTQMRSLRVAIERAEVANAAATRVRRARIQDLDQRRDLNAQLAGELEVAEQKLQVMLRGVSSGQPLTEQVSLPLRPFRGVLDWPTAGPVRRRFGPAPGPGAGVAESRGIEIEASEGTPVRAVHEGTVAFADPYAGFGNLVIVDHGAQTLSLYGDLLEIAVTRGERIERGRLVGTVGTAPAGPAGLYFELRIDGRPVDPLQWLRKP